MSTAAITTEPQIQSIQVTDSAITATLVDGRSISVPIEWSWRLSQATSAQQNRYEILGDGHYVHWPEVDEDLSVEGMLNGTPAPRA